MTVEERRELISAAEKLEALAVKTTGGTWSVHGLLATRPEVITQLPDGSTEHIADARANTADWIVTVSPDLAGPLAAWLRSAAEHAAISPEALAVSRSLVRRGRRTSDRRPRGRSAH